MHCTDRQALIFLVPESPRWLLAHGMTRDGLDVLERLRGTEAARDEWREIQAAIEVESLEKSGKGSLLVECLQSIFWDTTDLRIGRRLRLCIAVGFLQEMSGLNIVSKVPWRGELEFARSAFSTHRLTVSVFFFLNHRADCRVYITFVPAHLGLLTPESYP
jgi:hypothetical protein